MDGSNKFNPVRSFAGFSCGVEISNSNSQSEWLTSFAKDVYEANENTGFTKNEFDGALFEALKLNGIFGNSKSDLPKLHDFFVNDKKFSMTIAYSNGSPESIEITDPGNRVFVVGKQFEYRSSDGHQNIASGGLKGKTLANDILASFGLL